MQSCLTSEGCVDDGAVLPQPAPIQTFVFIDLATSCLQKLDRPKIIEICMIALHRNSLCSAKLESDNTPQLPRVQDRLTLCINPNKAISPVSSEMTGLDNHILVEETKRKIFDADIAKMLQLFLARQDAPVCLVAHNGNRFDFQLLRTELDKVSERFSDEVLCVDSLEAFAQLDKLTTTNQASSPAKTSVALGNICTYKLKLHRTQLISVSFVLNTVFRKMGKQAWTLSFYLCGLVFKMYIMA